MNCNIRYEELASFADGDLNPARLTEMHDHVQQCPACQDRLQALRQIDQKLSSLPHVSPGIEALLATRKAISEAHRASQPQEIMTLDEVAAFLRLTPEQLGEVADELPAFELAGQVRIRRQRLMEWVHQREQDYNRQKSQRWVTKTNTLKIGVAG